MHMVFILFYKIMYIKHTIHTISLLIWIDKSFFHHLEKCKTRSRPPSDVKQDVAQHREVSSLAQNLSRQLLHYSNGDRQ